MIGKFNIDLNLDEISKELSMTIPVSDISTNIFRNTNISNMIGEFYHNNQNLHKNSISNIVSELLSNSLKYSRKDSDIKISTYMNNDTSIYVMVENMCTHHQLKYLNNYLSNLVNSEKDIEGLYLSRVMLLSKKQKLGRAQLGLLSLMMNFNCLLDIKTHMVDRTPIVSTVVVFKGVSNEQIC